MSKFMVVQPYCKDNKKSEEQN